MIINIKNRIVSVLKRILGQPNNKKHEMLRIAFPAIKSWKVKGEYFEFGVYQGRAMIEAYRMSKRYDRPTLMFAFDSFEGLPPSSEAGDKFQEGQYACSEEQFRENLRRAGVDLSNVHCISGFFDISLTPELSKRLERTKVAIVWVDCDLYDSTVPVLEFIVPFLQVGSILCFDDWFSFGGDLQKGEIRAVNEWLEKYPEIKITHYKDFGISGRSFVVQSVR